MSQISASMSVARTRPINLPTRNMGFQQEYDATTAASEDLNLPRHSGASRGSPHTAASTVPTLLKPGSVGTSFRKLVADFDSLASQTSSRKLAADVDHETNVPSVSESVSKGRERPKRCENIERQTKCPHKSLSGKLNWPCEEKKWFRKHFSKLRQTWRSNIGKQEIRILLFKRSVRSLNPNDYSYNRRINGLIQLKETT